MKQCPNCKGIELYDDSEVNCPHCDTILVPYRRIDSTAGSSIPAAQNVVRPHNTSVLQTPTQDPVFEQAMGGRIIYRGVVTSITPTSRYTRNSVKWINSFFGGQPFQFGNPVYETVIRIEEITRNRIPERMRNLIYYGDAGELDIGDDITVTAIRKNDRYIIQDVLINDTESRVNPQGQISASSLRMTTLAVFALVILFIYMLVSFFTSGGIWNLLGALAAGISSIIAKFLVTTSPLIGLVIIYWLLIKGRK